MKNIRLIILSLVTVSLALSVSCASKKSVNVSVRAIPANASVAVIIDCPNPVKNIVMASFIKKGFTVKAVNATDFYQLSDAFDIRDVKYIAYNHSGQSLLTGDALLASEKLYENIYKLHVYNYEASKAEYLTQMKDKWNVKYLVILDLKNWKETSWGRAIDLTNYDVIWIENYPTTHGDNVESIVNHFLTSISGK